MTDNNNGSRPCQDATRMTNTESQRTSTLAQGQADTREVFVSRVVGADDELDDAVRPEKTGTDLPVLAAALDYARRGWPVLPLHSVVRGVCSCGNSECGRSKGKHPRTANGVHDASTDSSLIESWWKRWPTANVGVATGERSRIDVLDVDGEVGTRALGQLVSQHGELPETPRSRTGRTGFPGKHTVFQHAPGLTIGQDVLGKGSKVDLRGEGGYFVAPPSIHESGNTYAWEISPDDASVAEWPEWLLDVVRRKGRSAEERGTKAEAPAECSASNEDQKSANTPGERDTQRTRAVLSQLPKNAASARWLGALAARRQVVDLVRPLVEDQAAFDDGVSAFERREPVARPTDDEALIKRIERAVTALARPKASPTPRGDDDHEKNPIPGVRIVKLTRWTRRDGRGERIDLEIATPAGITKVANLTKEIGNYERVSQRAILEGVCLPYLGRKGNLLWRAALGKALAREEVREVVSEGSRDNAIETAIRRALRERDRGEESKKDLDAGLAVERADQVFIKPDFLLRDIWLRLPNDRVERDEFGDAVLRLGAEWKQLDLPDGRPRVLSFPKSVIEDDEAPPTPTAPSAPAGGAP